MAPATRSPGAIPSLSAVPAITSRTARTGPPEGTRLGLLAPQLLSGTPTRVLRAADTARAAADAAGQVLRDAAARQRYDEEIGARPTGTGLDTPAPVPSGLDAEIYGRDMDGEMVLAAIAELLTAHPGPARRVILSDLRGLFTRSCLRASGGLGLHVDMVQLTAQPMAVEGLVVDQFSRAGQQGPPGRHGNRAGLAPTAPRQVTA